MNIKKKYFDEVLALWILNDPKVWRGLRRSQIKLLTDHIIKQCTFKFLSSRHNLKLGDIKQLFRVVLLKIEKIHGQSTSNLIASISKQIEEGTKDPLSGKIDPIQMN